MQTTERDCPLCMEPLEIDDVNFYPCTCGYQICRFCWHRIRTDENGLCPACRKAYSEDPAVYTPLSQDEIQSIIRERKHKDTQRKQKLTENRKHLANVRVVQKNLVFVVGLTQRLADPELLKKPEYFGKFGKIHKIVINNSTNYAGPQGPSASAYITFNKEEDACRAILAVSNAYLDGRTLKTSLGTTKYCSYFLRNIPCPKPDCMYLHEFGDEAASFTKEAMQVGKHQEYEQQLLANYAKKMGITTDKVSKDLWQVGSGWTASSGSGWTLKSDGCSASPRTCSPHSRDSPPGLPQQFEEPFHESEDWEIPSPVTVQEAPPSTQTETETQQASTNRNRTEIPPLSSLIATHNHSPPNTAPSPPNIAPSPPNIAPSPPNTAPSPPHSDPIAAALSGNLASTAPVISGQSSFPAPPPESIAQSIPPPSLPPQSLNDTGWPLNPSIDAAPTPMSYNSGPSLFGSGDIASGLGLSNLHLKISGEDDLGFDPWNESSKGLADLLQEEQSPFAHLTQQNPTLQSRQDFIPAMGFTHQMAAQPPFGQRPPPTGPAQNVQDDFKSWQEGLRALLPNINISFSDGIPDASGWPSVTTGSRSRGPSEWSPATHSAPQPDRPAVRPPPGFESKTPDPHIPMVDDPSIVWSKVIGGKSDPLPLVPGLIPNGYPNMSANTVTSDLPGAVAVQSTGMLTSNPIYQSTAARPYQPNRTAKQATKQSSPAKSKQRPVSEPFAAGGGFDPSILQRLGVVDDVSQIGGLTKFNLNDPPYFGAVPLKSKLTQSLESIGREEMMKGGKSKQKEKEKRAVHSAKLEYDSKKVEEKGSGKSQATKMKSEEKTKKTEEQPKTSKKSEKKKTSASSQGKESSRPAFKPDKQSVSQSKCKDSRPVESKPKENRPEKKKATKPNPKPSSSQESNWSLEDLTKFTEAADLLQSKLRSFHTDTDVIAEQQDTMSREVQGTLDKLQSQASDAVTAANSMLKSLSHSGHIDPSNLELLTRQVINAKNEAEAAELKLKTLIKENSKVTAKGKRR
ncbi:arginine-glutamic acid dipeptide repeats protein isoform X2 [Nematostella vectensis]|uniref:arginine-glutamic acid dipeptide repeats protein isoform X2 n=1 Tax=Nematostella vectensis TaxID=45351 RepID=UPI00138FD8DF|nr:arginine-glutamic acid dipeptide repeats protein isoform X2 [Nematostella vectensis]